jgi:hypothetical protein
VRFAYALARFRASGTTVWVRRVSEPSQDPSAASGWKDALPIARLFDESRGASLRGDVIGGISICVVMIPSVVAYADLVGLPPSPRALRGACRDARIRGLREFTAGDRRPRRGDRPPRRAATTYISMLLAAGAKPLFVCRQTGTSLDMIEKHYGDARVDAAQLDEMIGEFKPPTGNPPDCESRPAAVEGQRTLCVLRVPTRAGDRGRTGDVQLGKLAFYR